MIDRITGAIGDAAAWAFTQAMKIPHPVRLIIRDCLEGAAAALATVTIVVPQTADEAKSLAITLSIALGAAVIAVLRRRIWQAILDRIGGDEA